MRGEVAIAAGTDAFQPIAFVDLGAGIDEQRRVAVFEIGYMLDVELVVFDDAKPREVLFSQALCENRPDAVVTPGRIPPREDRQGRVS